MEILGIIAAVIGIATGLWFFADKAQSIFFDRKSASPSQYIREITLEKTPLFKTNTTVSLGKVSAIIGGNGVGKTAICEWLSVLEKRSNIDRWRKNSKHLPIIYSIKYGANSISNTRMNITKDRVSFNNDGDPVPEPASNCRFIFVKDVRFDWKEIDDLEALSLLLNLSKETVQEYLPRVGSSFYCTIQKIEQQIEEDEDINILVDMEGTIANVRLRLLSHSEIGRVVIEAAIAIAQYLSQRIPVIVVIERSFSSIDYKWMQKYVDWVLRENFNFQIIFNSIPDPDDVDWSKCHVVNLIGNPPNVCVDGK